MSETRVYCLDVENRDLNAKMKAKKKKVSTIDVVLSIFDMGDEEFIEESERQGLVYSLKGFEEAFNNSSISDEWIIRIRNINN
jgi:hypothetical protein